MVYCTKCGFENADDSKFCAKCGAPLYPSVGEPPQRRVEEYGRRRPEREMCFGISGGFWALLIGLAIVLWGVSEIIQIYSGFAFPWWPIIVIIIGVFMIARYLRRQI